MLNKSRLALVCTSVNELGGQVDHLKSLYRNLDKDRFKVFIVCCSKIKVELRNYMVGDGIGREDIVFLSRTRKWLIIPLIFELKRFFLEKKIDIVHTTDMQSDIFGAIAARISGMNYIFSLHNSKIILDDLHPLKRFLYRLCNSMVKDFFIKTVVVSRGLKTELISGGFRPSGKVEVIHIGFNVPDEYKGHEFSFDGLKQGRPLIGSVGRLSKEKGMERFIAAMPLVLKQVPDAKFLILGKGLEEEYLKSQIKELNLKSKVVFKRWVDDIFALIKSIDIFVMTSVREGCPIALLEALALKRPAVASRIDGIVDIIEDGKDGLLVDAANPKDIAEKILFLCKNPQEAISLGKNGYQKVTGQFTVEREMMQIRQLYENSTRS